MLEEAKKVQRRIEVGDLAAADAAATAAAAGDGAAVIVPQPVFEQEGATRTVMIVESKIEAQDLLRERLKKHGYRVLIFSDPLRAITRFEDADRRPADCVVFSTVNLGRSALDAFNKFGVLASTKDVPAILFVDEKQTELVKSAALSEHRVLLSMPLKVRELRSTLLKLLAEPQVA
jgi:serine/threonine-protein kinase